MSIIKLNIIFNNSECISTDKMISFLNVELNEKENNHIEKHLLVCEMCKDEIEGIKELSEFNRIENIVSELNKSVDKKIKQKHNKTMFLRNNYLQIAAVILIIISSTFFINNFINYSKKNMQSDESIAQNITIEEENIEKNDNYDIIEEEVAENEGKSEAKSIEKTIKNKIDKKQETKFQTIIIKDNNKVGDNKTEAVLDAELEPVLEIKDDFKGQSESINDFSEIAYNRAIEFDENDKKRKSKSIEKESIKGESQIKKSNKRLFFSKKRSNNNLDTKDIKNKEIVLSSNYEIKSQSDFYFKKGLKSYYNNDYKTARKYFEQSLILKNNANSNYYLALTFIKFNDNKKAIEYFNKVLVFTNSKYFYEALWQKAIIFIKSEEKETTINLLYDIYKADCKYSKQAKMKLDSLKNK